LVEGAVPHIRNGEEEMKKEEELDSGGSIRPATKELEMFQVKVISNLRSSVEATRKTFVVNFYLNIIIVVIGIFLLLIAVGQSILQGIDFLSVTFGSLGVANFVAVFLLNPQSRLQENLCKLSQMNVILGNFLYEYDNFLNFTSAGVSDLKKLTEINKEGERIVSFTLGSISDLTATHPKEVDGNRSE